MTKPVAFVPFPAQTAKTVARMLRGHRFQPIKDGWLLVYEDERAAPTPALIDALCIVETSDHRILTRILKPGRRAGCWDLLTGIGDQELDVALKWAAPVTLIVPFSPTPDDMAQFQPIS